MQMGLELWELLKDTSVKLNRHSETISEFKFSFPKYSHSSLYHAAHKAIRK